MTVSQAVLTVESTEASRLMKSLISYSHQVGIDMDIFPMCASFQIVAASGEVDVMRFKARHHKLPEHSSIMLEVIGTVIDEYCLACLIDGAQKIVPEPESRKMHCVLSARESVSDEHIRHTLYKLKREDLDDKVTILRFIEPIPIETKLRYKK